MCGIAGIFNPAGFSTETVTGVSKLVRHRGPEDEGYLFVDNAGKFRIAKGSDTISELSYLEPVKKLIGDTWLTFIHRRLSIIDLSPTGHQPMVFEKNGTAIIFNGEIYNYLELREELKKYGYYFNTESDTEVILASYDYWSERCVDHFLGMWSFSIYDPQRNILFCSRDRFGIKPFYYFEQENFFAFGSEIKVLLSLPQVRSRLDRRKAIEFLVNGNQNFGSDTIFNGCKLLPPGNNLIYDFNKRNVTVTNYYQVQLTDSLSNISLEEAIEEFGTLVDNSLSLHLRSDVPIGSCLSGGLDSGTIISNLSRRDLPYKLSAFTASFPDLPIDESVFITELNKQYGFNVHYTYPDPAKLWNELDIFLWHQERPVQSTSMYAQWEVMKIAHEHSVKVLLDGQGMDEILGGYSEFIGAFLLGQLSKGYFIKFFHTLSDLKSNYRTSSVSNELSRALFYYVPENLRNGIYSANRLGPSLISKKYQDELKDIKFEKRIFNSVRETSMMSISNILPSLLRYEDRSSMAFSVESRVPYLDHRLVEFCINLPDDFKIYKGWTKYVLRKSSERYLPSDITWRKEKLGFITPEKVWVEALMNEIIEYVQKNPIPDIINPDRLISLIKGGINDRIKLGEIWKVILFIRWFKVFNLE
jgi:asparagine synthase (glutamine-hydrolysing)